MRRLVSRRLLFITAPLLVLMCAGLATLTDTKPAEAYSVRATGCLFGQGCQWYFTTGVGGVYTRACGQTINGNDICSAFGSGFCSTPQGCAWISTIGGSFNISWLYVEVYDESYSAIAWHTCTGSGSFAAQAGQGSAAAPGSPMVRQVK